MNRSALTVLPPLTLFSQCIVFPRLYIINPFVITITTLMIHPETNETVVYETDNQEDVSACSLVLSAVDISHTITVQGSSYAILVSTDKQRRAMHHLTAYQTENSNWPPVKNPPEEVGASLEPPTLIVIGALMIFYAVTGPWNMDSPWFAQGAGDSEAILRQGEYYRLITALTLHADLTHLLGNCFFGSFLLHFFCRTAGPGIGVLAMLLAAALGNYINVVLHGSGHHFIGFSTAVFALIGMQAMVGYHTNRKLSKIQIAAPFMAGAALLAMTGSSGVRTDLGAHLFGLFSGFGVGRVLMTDFFLGLRHSARLQSALFIFACLLVYLSWDMAMERVF